MNLDRDNQKVRQDIFAMLIDIEMNKNIKMGNNNRTKWTLEVFPIKNFKDQKIVCCPICF